MGKVKKNLLKDELTPRSNDFGDFLEIIKKNIADKKDERDIIGVLKNRLIKENFQTLKLENRIKLIESSMFWKILMNYQQIINILLPSGTNRRTVYDRIIRRNHELINSKLSIGQKIKLLFEQDEYEKLVKISGEKFTGIFPKFDNPIISIIILAFNKKYLTEKCLKSVFLFSDVPYEIIIVDNASSDETLNYLKKLKNINIVENKENQGFVNGCNQASEGAKGRYLVFLNNDTVVSHQWLSGLLKTIEANPLYGIIGAKLLQPKNGKLQEAGGIIWSNGHTKEYGRGCDPNKPEYSYLREVDSVSGACLMIPKQLFEKVEKFDKIFYPAYYEDTDLCMKVSRAGYKIVYQPEVKVYHHEHASLSPEKAMELMEKGHETFLKKWRAVLSEKFPQSEENIIRARGAKRNKKILFIYNQASEFDGDSTYEKLSEFIKNLSESGYGVTIFSLLKDRQALARNFQQMGVEVFIDGNYDIKKLSQERFFYYDLITINGRNEKIKTIVKENFIGVPIVDYF